MQRLAKQIRRGPDYIRKVRAKIRAAAPELGPGGRLVFAWNCALSRVLRKTSIDEYCYYYRRTGSFTCWKRVLNRRKAWGMWKLNTPETIDRLMDKTGCLERYAEFVHREWMRPAKHTEEEFLDFARRHKAYIVKPNDSGRGEGVHKETYENDEQAREQYRRLAGEDALIEECIVQHPAMARVCPTSVNTVRICSALTENGPVLLSPVLRMGTGAVTDNYSRGGLVSMIDIETGKVETAGVDHDFRVCEKHPVSGTKLEGYQLPNWEILKETVRRAALVDPDAIFVGWDMAITDQGVDMVECNNNAFFRWQYALGTPWRPAYIEANKQAKRYYRQRQAARRK